MGQMLDDYLDQEAIKKDMRRKECKSRGVYSCYACGRPTRVRVGTSTIGHIICEKCRGLRAQRRI
jgi:ribosomal protein L37AE/L43A